MTAITAIGATIAVLAPGAASADRPVEIVDADTFTDVNPCTGLDHEVTIDFVFSLHLHDGRQVVHVARTGSTDSGYVMEHGVQSFVSNGQVVRTTFKDNWMNADGSRFKAQGSFAGNLNTGETLVDRFRLRCITA